MCNINLPHWATLVKQLFFSQIYAQFHSKQAADTIVSQYVIAATTTENDNSGSFTYDKLAKRCFNLPLAMHCLQLQATTNVCNKMLQFMQRNSDAARPQRPMQLANRSTVHPSATIYPSLSLSLSLCCWRWLLFMLPQTIQHVFFKCCP